MKWTFIDTIIKNWKDIFDNCTKNFAEGRLWKIPKYILLSEISSDFRPSLDENRFENQFLLCELIPELFLEQQMDWLLDE